MSTLEQAIAIAAQAHTGQVDKAGQPYILHPIRVLLMVTTEFERMAAILHDVVEDSPVTFEELAAAGFPDEVIEAIRALTKTKGEGRLAAAKRAAQNAIAKNVKLADVLDNMNLARISEVTEKDYARLEEYKQVHALLVEHGATCGHSVPIP